MADVLECIDKLVVAGQISRAIGKEAAEFFQRSRAEWSREMGPASADAAAALETAKKMHDKAVNNQIAIAADVKGYQTAERRVLEDPRGTNAAAAGMVAKDTLIGDTRLRDLRKAEPDHPIFTGGNADTKGEVVKLKLAGMLGTEIEKFRPGLGKGKERLLQSSRDFVSELFGVDTGNAAAKSVAEGFQKMVAYAAARAKAAGRIFSEIDDWRIMQHWEPAQVGKVSEAEYVKDHMAEVTNGGLKLFDKDTNRYAKAERYEDILKKAYSDIRYEGGSDAPFSKEHRTFEFQPGQAGADSWLKLQGKYGVGNEVMASVMNHIDHMARTIALHEQFGGHPDAVFEAIMRLVSNNPSVPVKGFGWMTSERTIRNTYNIVSGRGYPVGSETGARIMAGLRDIIGSVSLRNLPLNIVPGDSAMTLLASSHSGMSGFSALAQVFDGTVTREVAAHMQIAAHGYIDFANNFLRRYEDQINVSGLARRVSRAVTWATGANAWTTNGRLGFMVDRLNQISRFSDLEFGQLNREFRENFLGQYGFTEADWNKIRASTPFEASNGAKYLDVNELERPMAERILGAIREQSSYAFHQPDARTQALIRQGAVRGTPSGEAWLSGVQYKQFVMERMTTHLMRVAVDGPLENRIWRGVGFVTASIAAGAVSLQAAAVLAGKDPLDMANPKFWLEAFARGGAGGIYGDIIGAAFHGDRGGTNIATQFAGPMPGFLGDIAALAINPARRELDQHGRSQRTWGSDISSMGQRWTPNTWYTKLAVDRMIWDQMQMLIDPQYRQSFHRAEERARKEGSGYWWAKGETAPERPPMFH